MFNYTEILQHLYNGQFEIALEILQTPLSDENPIDLSEEDKQQLLSILVVLHERTIGLPQNTGEFEQQYQQALQANPLEHFSFDDLILNEHIAQQDFAFDDFILNEHAAPIEYSLQAHSEIFSISSRIFNEIRMLLDHPTGRAPNGLSARATASLRAEQNDCRLIEFLIHEENHARGFLRNVIFQEYIANYARDSRTSFYHRLMTNQAFTHYICQDIHPNYFLGENNEDILTRASRYDASAAVYDALVYHGADVNGCGTRPSFFHSPMTRQVNEHSLDPMESYKIFLHPRLQAPGAKVFFQNGLKTPLIEAILSGHFEHVKCLLASPKIILTRNEHEPLQGCRSMSPLMLAAYLGHLNIVQVLLTRGANINEVDNVGESAIFYALRANQSSVFYFLLEHPEVNTQFINLQGQSLRDLMRSFNYPGLIDMFRPHERLVLLMTKRPSFLEQYIFDLLEKRLTVIVTDLKKEEVIPFLTRHQKQFTHPNPLYFPRNRQNGFMGKFLMISEKHLDLPSIYANLEKENEFFQMVNPKTYVVMKAANDATYRVYDSRYTLDKTRHLLIFAHQLQRLKYFPVDCLLKILNFFTSEEIISLFETPEEAAQILNDQALDNPGNIHGGGFSI